MTRSGRLPATPPDSADRRSPPPTIAAGMRLIVPLQGIVQGRGGLVLGSIIPCALFYALQTYLRRRHPPPPPPAELGPGIRRSHSRSILSPRGSSAPVPVSARAAVVNTSDAGVSLGDTYDPATNPDGIIHLCRAENKLSAELLIGWLAKNLNDSMLDETHVSSPVSGLAIYQPLDGLMEMKMAIARFMTQVMQGLASFNPSRIVLTAGASPSMEILSFCLADPGNAFLVPSPYYPGLDRNIKWRSGVELVHVPCRSTDSFNLSIAALERAYNQAKKRGVKVRGVVLSNPSNPVGKLLSKETLYDLLDFVTEKNIHLICDEMYAGSIHGSSEFVSIAELLETEGCDASRVHIVNGLSKDLCIPGCRMGVIYTSNETVLAAAKKMARFSSVSVPAQRILISMLSHRNFIVDFVEVNRKRLHKMHSLFVEGLKQLGIHCAEGTGGFYCWADMSKIMQSYSEKGEMELCDRLLRLAKITVLPGSQCHCIEPGWFGFCFTTLKEADIPVVIERIRTVTGRR